MADVNDNNAAVDFNHPSRRLCVFLIIIIINIIDFFG